MVGFAEDGSLITAGVASAAGKFGVWRWTLPGGVRSEIWSTATKRATSDEPIEASISENRRWLTLSGDAMTEVSVSICSPDGRSAKRTSNRRNRKIAPGAFERRIRPPMRWWIG